MTLPGQNFSILIGASSLNEDDLAKTNASSLYLISGGEKQTFAIEYNCKGLLEQEEDYFDTIFVTLSDGSASITLDYIVVCEPE
eukprot:CAMPEP_0170553944 /NCGR_PEP_ID=MMETSP0211-20121228/11792_1 /TAXON_ID=311385 /ORGANISM="Pseudokeronopsis sp., Strain OXSARD2" /LENGTH=83 /DNA_ID=CAMNT_0010862633 /DNA_START=311 /DNA_END=562 /DNA_ORIENTATION=+